MFVMAVFCTPIALLLVKIFQLLIDQDLDIFFLPLDNVLVFGP